ncbi:sex-determining region Y protein isoform X2 [Eurytemora carolleeae]|uniref:sex-determining region Y protein isoform X2 n=1 Tax=Eurytemora carolleeae TaxID=1294199 RepID=UPI000C77CB69|nr:sex-determining region Y protein isoform X2 [Eurytemora carolleeae]|eukprot:XP_023339887.1 sex-determining region Y protein-like isoform X2 [Eurytemora affinis]
MNTFIVVFIQVNLNLAVQNTQRSDGGKSHLDVWQNRLKFFPQEYFLSLDDLPDSERLEETLLYAMPKAERLEEERQDLLQDDQLKEYYRQDLPQDNQPKEYHRQDFPQDNHLKEYQHQDHPKDNQLKEYHQQDLPQNDQPKTYHHQDHPKYNQLEHHRQDDKLKEYQRQDLPKNDHPKEQNSQDHPKDNQPTEYHPQDLLQDVQQKEHQGQDLSQDDQLKEYHHQDLPLDNRNEEISLDVEKQGGGPAIDPESDRQQQEHAAEAEQGRVNLPEADRLLEARIVDEVNLAGLNSLKSFGYNDDLQADRVEESNNVMNNLNPEDGASILQVGQVNQQAKQAKEDLGVPQGQVVVPAVPQGGSFSLGEFDGETLGRGLNDKAVLGKAGEIKGQSAENTGLKGLYTEL